MGKKSLRAQLALAVVLLIASFPIVGCGRLSFDPIPGETDSGTDASSDVGTDAPIDAGIDVFALDAGDGGSVADGSDASDGAAADAGRSIAIDTPFGAATLVVELASEEGDDDDPSLTGDMLDVFFNSYRAGGEGRGDVWTARRSSPSESFSAPVPVPELNSEIDEGNVDVSRDGLTIWVARSPDMEPASDLFVSTRATRDSFWSTPTLVSALVSAGHDEAVGTDSTLRTIVFESNRGDSSDLFSATRSSSSDPWSTPLPIATLNTNEQERQPWLGPSARFIVFVSNRPGGVGDADMYMASRATTEANYDVPVPVPGINSALGEFDPWLSDDGRTIFFSRDVDGATRILTAVR